MTRWIASIAALVAALIGAAAAAPAPAFAPEGERMENVLLYGDFLRATETREVAGEGPVEFVSWLTLEAARAAPEADFHALSEGLDDRGFYWGFVWLRLRIENPTDETRIWRLYSGGTGSSSWTEAYIVEPDGSASLLWRDPVGENPKDVDYSFEDRTPMLRESVSRPFAVSPGETVEIWLDYPNGAFPEFGPDLVSDHWFAERSIAAAGYNMFLFGLRAALLFAILAFALILRSKVALYYALFTASLFVYFTAVYGFLTRPLLRDVDLAAHVSTVFGVLAFIFFVQMTRAFLNAPKIYPRLDKILIGVVAFGALNALLAVVFFGNTVLTLTAFIPGLVAIVSVTLWAAFVGVRNRHQGAGIYFVAALTLFGSIAFGLLSYPPFYIVDGDITGPVTHAGLTLDGALFAGALVAQAIGLRRERDEAHAAEVVALKERADAMAELSDVAKAHQSAVALAERRRKELAAASHDMKQPLLSLQLALRGREDIDAVSHGLSYLESVLASSLDATRPEERFAEEQAPTQEERRAFPIRKALESCVLMFADEAAAKGVALRSVDTSVATSAEPVVLMRILTNLVSNAVKHCDRGRILIGVRRRTDAASVWVVDTGPGMSAAQIAELTRPYTKGEGSEGEGLGLAVVAELARSLGGRLSVKSDVGRGTLMAVDGLPLPAE